MKALIIRVFAKLICVLMICNIFGCYLVNNITFYETPIEHACDWDTEDTDDIFYEFHSCLFYSYRNINQVNYISREFNSCLQFHPDIAPPPPKG